MLNSRTLLIVLTMTLLLLSACAPPPPPTVVMPETEIATSVPASKAPTAAAQAVQQVAADALNVDPESVTVLKMEEVDWPDASLGCPQPGMMYAQVITPGYKATVEVDGKTYDVHMNANGKGVICSPKS
ncbi:MAG TPA: hypothetical protein G4N94_05785 [Caldilineae bacterium]|nr:hypothetical protein [Caldilineae bacterium]